jgi:hypothetical protein
MRFSKGEVICREDLAYPEGALVCDGYDAAGRLLAHPLGGGFQLTVPARDEPRFRVVAEEEEGAALFHRGKFTLGDSVEAFEGWSNGELWNGWEMPRFEAGVGIEILAFLGGERARFDGTQPSLHGALNLLHLSCVERAQLSQKFGRGNSQHALEIERPRLEPWHFHANLEL